MPPIKKKAPAKKAPTKGKAVTSPAMLKAQAKMKAKGAAWRGMSDAAKAKFGNNFIKFAHA